MFGCDGFRFRWFLAGLRVIVTCAGFIAGIGITG